MLGQRIPRRTLQAESAELGETKRCSVGRGSPMCISATGYIGV